MPNLPIYVAVWTLKVHKIAWIFRVFLVFFWLKDGYPLPTLLPQKGRPPTLYTTVHSKPSYSPIPPLKPIVADAPCGFTNQQFVHYLQVTMLFMTLFLRKTLPAFSRKITKRQQLFMSAVGHVLIKIVVGQSLFWNSVFFALLTILTRRNRSTHKSE
jgi:hypothetical protein